MGSSATGCLVVNICQPQNRPQKPMTLQVRSAQHVYSQKSNYHRPYPPSPRPTPYARPGLPQVSLWVPYWVVNATSLPLVFQHYPAALTGVHGNSFSGDDNLAAGQQQQHAAAANPEDTPASFDRDGMEEDGCVSGRRSRTTSALSLAEKRGAEAETGRARPAVRHSSKLFERPPLLGLKELLVDEREGGGCGILGVVGEEKAEVEAGEGGARVAVGGGDADDIVRYVEEIVFDVTDFVFHGGNDPGEGCWVWDIDLTLARLRETGTGGVVGGWGCTHDEACHGH